MLPHNSNSTATGEENPVRVEGQLLSPDVVQQKSTNSATATDLHYSIWRGFIIPNGGVGYGYDRAFADCLGERLTSVRVEDPYIRSNFQIQNLFRFCKLLGQKCKNFKAITLITADEDRKYEAKIKQKLNPLLIKSGITLDFDHNKDLHDRQIDFDNGWRVMLGRGLDYFKPLKNPTFGDVDDMNHRSCKGTTITILRDETNVNADKEVREVERAWDRASRLLGEYAEHTVIERGGFGVIFKAQHKLEKRLYAIKQVGPVGAIDAIDAVDTADTEQSPDKVLREMNILAKLDHPHIVRYYDAWMEKPPPGEELPWMDSNQPCLYTKMEWCSGSTLHEWLGQNQLPEERPISQTLDWFSQLVSAIKYIHDRKVIHRDIKPQNIFFGSSREGAASALKIGGFGLATYAPASLSSGVSGDVKASLSVVGTEMYMSPEQPSGHYKNSTDIFSLGLVFLEMVHLFKTDRERRGAFGALRSKQRPKVMKQLDKKTDELISWMTVFEPKRRPTASELDNELKRKRGETNVNVELHHEFKIPDGSTGYGYDRVFADCLDEKLTSVRVVDAYIRFDFQIQNLFRFCKLLEQKCKNFKAITLITRKEGNKYEEKIKQKLNSLLTKSGITLNFEYKKDPHDRNIDFGNGWRATLGRGLDYFNKLADPSSGDVDDMNHRTCKETTITILRDKTNVDANPRNQSKIPTDSMSSRESKKTVKRPPESANEAGVEPHAETNDDTDSNVQSEAGTSSTHPNKRIRNNKDTVDEVTAHVDDLELSPGSTADLPVSESKDATL